MTRIVKLSKYVGSLVAYKVEALPQVMLRTHVQRYSFAFSCCLLASTSTDQVLLGHGFLWPNGAARRKVGGMQWQALGAAFSS
jgi:hypothetical protein